MERYYPMKQKVSEIKMPDLIAQFKKTVAGCTGITVTDNYVRVHISDLTSAKDKTTLDSFVITWQASSTL